MTRGTTAAQAGGREWRRFTAAQRSARFTVYLFMLAAIVVSARSVEIIPEFLYDAPEQMRDLFVRMWPVAFYHYPEGVHAALVETLHIATLGTILAVLMALPIGVAAAYNVVPSRTINYFAKLLLVSSRSVNSLVWALLFVAVFGPGALAGTLAIAFRSIGFVGKLIGEALEEAERGPIEALAAAGAPWLSLLSKGYWPQITARVLVDSAVPLGHQRARVRGAGPRRCGRHRHGARYRPQPVPVAACRDGSVGDICRWS